MLFGTPFWGGAVSAGSQQPGSLGGVRRVLFLIFVVVYSIAELSPTAAKASTRTMHPFLNGSFVSDVDIDALRVAGVV